jgi:hypothetical protein
VGEKKSRPHQFRPVIQERKIKIVHKYRKCNEIAKKKRVNDKSFTIPQGGSRQAFRIVRRLTLSHVIDKR